MLDVDMWWSVDRLTHPSELETQGYWNISLSAREYNSAGEISVGYCLRMNQNIVIMSTIFLSLMIHCHDGPHLGYFPVELAPMKRARNTSITWDTWEIQPSAKNTSSQLCNNPRVLKLDKSHRSFPGYPTVTRLIFLKIICLSSIEIMVITREDARWLVATHTSPPFTTLPTILSTY